MEQPKLTFADVQASYDKAFLLKDRQLVRLMTAVVLANQLPGAPVWLMIVASSSGGKSALLMTLDELEFVPGKRVSFFISDLTENTLASGFKSAGGDSSLLNQLPTGGLLIFKDFTSMLEKRQESRNAIMAQLREVYDRKFDKKTGNGQNVSWKGKAGALAGVTEAVHEYMASMSVMGDRFIMYTPFQPDRMKLLNFIMDMRMSGQSQEDRIKDAQLVLHTYLKQCAAHLGKATLSMREADQQYLMRVADFVTQVRSGVMEDKYTGRVIFVPSAEMPTRLIDQLLAIATVLSKMRELDGFSPQLVKEDMNLLYKIAFDSIPIKRRWALKHLSKHLQGVTTAGIAAAIGYETEVVKQWLAQLNALGVIRRNKNMGNGDQWMIQEEFRDIMATHEGITPINEILEDPNQDEDEAFIDRALRDNAINPASAAFDKFAKQ